MSFNFDWNYVRAGAPYISLSELGISFSSTAMQLIGKPDQIEIGFDEGRKILGFRRHESSSSAPTYEFASRAKNDWVRIGCKDFIKQLESLTGLSFKKSQKFIARKDEDDNLMYIEIVENEGNDEMNQGKHNSLLEDFAGEYYEETGYESENLL